MTEQKPSDRLRDALENVDTSGGIPSDLDYLLNAVCLSLPDIERLEEMEAKLPKTEIASLHRPDDPPPPEGVAP